jgi:alkaline phosphatase D
MNFFLLQLTILAAVGYGFVEHNRSAEVLHRIAFGSCYNPNKGDAIWNLISSVEPNQLILLGDQIYADFHPVYKFKYLNGSDPFMIEREYRKFFELKGWNDLVKSLSHKWIAVYDDHDYGKDNGDKTYVFRQQGIDLFAKYNADHFTPDVMIPDSSSSNQMKQEKKNGVYSSHSFEFPLGSSGRSFKYKVILLDIRSNKDVKGTENGDFLGEQQWRWLEHELKKKNVIDYDLIIVGSGTQVLSDDKVVEESWGEFPKQRERLLSLLSLTKTRGTDVVIISGDIHCAEISQVRCSPSSPSSSGRKEEVSLVEFTSSGLSHTFAKIINWQEMKKQGLESSQIIMQTRSWAAELVSLLYHLLYPGLYREDKNGHVYQGLHFALLDIEESISSPSSSSSSSGVVTTSTSGGEHKYKLVFHIVDHEGKSIMWKELPLRSSRKKASVSVGVEVGKEEDEEEEKEPVSFQCEAIRGKLTPMRWLVFKANIAFFGVLLVVIPLLAILWFLFASVYYIFMGRELKRRDEVERNYQLNKDQHPVTTSHLNNKKRD